MISRTLAELATLCGAVVDGDAQRVVDGPASLAEAGPREISFLANPRYQPQFQTTRAAAVLVTADCARARPDLALLRCKDPSRAFTAVVQAFVPPPAPAPAGVHPRAWVDPTAAVDPTASVGPLCSVGAGAVIGAGAVLHASVSVGANARIGPDTHLHPAVVVYPGVVIGARCIVHGGTVLGPDGFGFEPTAAGWDKIPQCGTVVIEDDVEIGANVTIDRARFGATRIGRGVKIDNLVHVAHNVVVEENALLIAQVGIAGSSRVGKRAILAGQVGVTGHVTIGHGARVGAQSGISHDLPDGSEYFGSPARPKIEMIRQLALAAKLPEIQSRLRAIERRLEAAEAGAGTEETA